MTQDEINKAEWLNPEHWSEGALGFYFSKRDSRVIVPKRPPTTGWTLNVGHRHGARWLWGFVVFIVLFQSLFFMYLLGLRPTG